MIDTSDGSEIGFLDTGGSAPESLSLFSSDSQIAWYFSKNTILSIYDSSDPSNLVLASLVEATEEIKNFDFSPSGNLVALGLQAGNVELHTVSPAPRLISSYKSEVNEERNPTPINAVNFKMKSAH